MRAHTEDEFWATRFVGAGHAIRRRAFEAACGYDDRLFFGGEERDLCYRIINVGYRIRYVPSISVRHKIAPEGRVRWDAGRYYYAMRNTLYIEFKFGEPWWRLARSAAAMTARGAYNGMPLQSLRAVVHAIGMAFTFSRSDDDRDVYHLSREVRGYMRDCEMADEEPVAEAAQAVPASAGARLSTMTRFTLSRRDALAGIGATAGTLALPRRASAQSPAALRKRRAKKLQRGLMAAQWFEWVPNDPWKMHRQVDTKYAAEDFATLRKLGFDHIRVSIQPGFPAPQLGPKGDPTLDPMRLEVLDEAMSRILKNDLAVVLDCHPAPQTKDKVAQNPEYRQAMTDWWAAFAAHVVKQKQYSPETTFLELMNEPEKSFEDIALFRSTMEGMIAAVRKTAPDYTIIVGGPAWNVAEGIFNGLKTPYADQNIIYPFHFYKPMEFTHQGLAWAGPLYGKLRDMPVGCRQGIDDGRSDPVLRSIDPEIGAALQRPAQAQGGPGLAFRRVAQVVRAA